MAEKAAEIAIFQWEGTDRKGQPVKGELKGSNPTVVKTELRRQGIRPNKVKKKSKPLFGPAKKKIVPKDISVFSRQLATMMSSGVPLVQSFEIIGRGQDNPAMGELVLAIKSEVEGGATMADAFSKHPQYFDDLTCNLINAGEQAGILEDLLGKIATYKEKTENIKSKVKKALFYPTAVVVVAFIIMAILLIFVIPQFQSMFEGFGSELPALTAGIVKLSEIFQSYWFLIFGGLFAFGYAFKQALARSPAMQDGLERVSLKVPVIGNILDKAAIARVARTLSTMFAAGVPLVEAMESVAGAAGNVVYRTAILSMRNEISTGTSMTEAMNHTAAFPNMVVQMASIGEEAGSIDTMLGKVADFYEQEVDDAVDALSSLLEPMIMAFLGGTVGTMVVAMYLPIFKMGSIVS